MPCAVFSCGDNCHSALMLQAMYKNHFPLVVSAAAREWCGQICCPVSFTPDAFSTVSDSQRHTNCVCFSGNGKTAMHYSRVWPSISVLLCCFAHKIYSLVEPLNMISFCTDKIEVTQMETTLLGLIELNGLYLSSTGAKG